MGLVSLCFTNHHFSCNLCLLPFCKKIKEGSYIADNFVCILNRQRRAAKRLPHLDGFLEKAWIQDFIVIPEDFHCAPVNHSL
jgi:hypothetical protein